VQEGCEKQTVLAGAVVYVARKLADQAAQYETIVSSLGGQVARELGPALTHFVFEVSRFYDQWPNSGAGILSKRLRKTSFSLKEKSVAG